MEVGHRELASIRRAHPRRQLVRDALVVAEEAHAEAEQIRGAQRIAVLLLVAGAVDARIDVRLDGVKSAAIVLFLRCTWGHIGLKHAYLRDTGMYTCARRVIRA